MLEVLAVAGWSLCMLCLRFARPRLARGCPRCASSAALLWAEGYLLGLVVLTAREALRLPSEFRAVLLWYGWPAGFHLLSHFAVWVCTALAARHLLQLRPIRARSPQRADLVADLVLLPATFGLLALHCLQLLADRQDPGLARILLSAAELWEGWALWSFQRLSMQPTPAPAGPTVAEQLCNTGFRQYLVLVAGLNGVEVLARLAAYSQPRTCDLLWGKETGCQQVLVRLHDHAAGALWSSSAVALYSLACFEGLPGQPRLRRPRPKFRGARLIVAMASVQRLLLAAGAAVSLWKEASAWSAHASLLCLESCVLAALQLQAYRGDELVEDAPPSLKKPTLPIPRATTYGKLDDNVAAGGGTAGGVEPGAQPAGRPRPMLPPLALPAQAEGGAPSRAPRVAVPRLPLPLPMDQSEGTMPHYSGSPSPSSSQTMDWISGPPSGSSRTGQPTSDRSNLGRQSNGGDDVGGQSNIVQSLDGV